jgi:hypothetical protein
MNKWDELGDSLVIPCLAFLNENRSMKTNGHYCSILN